MIFIDGENVVARYQEMIKRGWKSRRDTRHMKDVYVWRKGCIVTHGEVLRINYYTYIVADDHGVQNTINEIKSLLSGLGGPSGNTLYPVVFKKEKKTAKGKGVDIQLTVDVLNHTFLDNLDIVHLVSGDGDYLPVLHAVQEPKIVRSVLECRV